MASAVRLRFAAATMVLGVAAGGANLACGAFGEIFSSADEDPALAVVATDAGLDAGADTETAGTVAIEGTSIRFRGKTRVSGTGDPLDELTIAAPAGARRGDFLVVAIAVSSEGKTVAPIAPSVDGQFEKRWAVGAQSSCTSHTYAVFTRRAGDAEPPSYGFRFATPATATALLASYVGVNDVPFDDERDAPSLPRTSAGVVNEYRYEAPQVTTTVPGTLLLYLLGDTSGPTWGTPSSPSVELVTDTNLLALFRQPAPTAGPTENVTFPVTNGCEYASSAGRTMALRPR